MDLFCFLAGHWPVPFASKRSNGRKLNHCWMCNEAIVHSNDGWRLEHEAPDTTSGRAGAALPPLPHMAAAGRAKAG